LLELNEGKEFNNVFKNQPETDFDFDFSQLQNTMNISNPVIAGHSFGGATTILTLISDERFKVGVALDAWMFPLRDKDVKVSTEKPILFVNTESFLNAINLKKLSVLQNATTDTEHRKFLFIRGSVHQNQLDMPFLIRNTSMKKVFGSYSKTSPDKVMNVNNKLIVQFLFDKLGMTPSPELDDEIRNSSFLLQYGLGLSDKTPSTE
jgi:platelet-activating factor acetylhydrolase